MMDTASNAWYGWTANPVLLTVVKATIVLASGLTLAALIRKGAALRHALLAATLGAAVVLPLSSVVIPHWRVAMIPTPAFAPVTQRATTPAPRVASNLPSVRENSVPQSHTVFEDGTVDGRTGPDMLRVALAAWLVGALLLAARLLYGHMQLRSINRQGYVLDTPEWRALLDAERRIGGVERDVRLLVSPDASTPLAWGIRQAVVLLPEEALEWPLERRRVVLRHELAHIARHDMLVQLIGAATCAIYWFHPLAWMTARRLRTECEQACDDRVIALGTSSDSYASHLLEIARAAHESGAHSLLSVAMARPGQLEGRLLAILDRTRSRLVPSRRTRAVAVTAPVALALATSAFQPVARVMVPAAPQSVPSTVLSNTPPIATSLPQMTSGEVHAPAAIPVARRDSLLTRSVAATPGGTLRVDIPHTGGSITVIGWDEPRVEVRARLAGRNWRETTLDLVQLGNGNVELRTGFTGNHENSSFSHAFELHVPHRFNLDVRSAGGEITLRDLSGSFEGSTGGGEIVADHVSGTMRLSTGGGEIHVSDSELDGRVTTGGGTVELRNVKGDLNGSQSFEGETSSRRRDKTPTSLPDHTVITHSTTTHQPDDVGHRYAKFGNDGIRMSRAGGTITLDAAPQGAHVTTGGGDVRIGRSAGEVFASTGGGDIQIGPAAGSVVASTGAGKIDVEFVGSGPHSADLLTGFGNAVLTLPTDFSGRLVLETAYTDNFGRVTRIENDFGGTVTETPDWDSSVGTPRRYVRSTVVVGNGDGVIRVRIINGDIRIRRAR